MKLSCCYEAPQRVKEIRFNLSVRDLRAKSILRPKLKRKISTPPLKQRPLSTKKIQLTAQALIVAFS